MPHCVSSAPPRQNDSNNGQLESRAKLLNRYLAFFAIAAGGCAADLASKSWAFNRLGMPGTEPPEFICGQILGLQTSLNQGALFGMGQGWVGLFAVLSVAALLGIFYWLVMAGAARDWLLTIALGMITAGVLGNLYDRLGLPGLVWPPEHPLAGEPVRAVRDFILIRVGSFSWPNFNLADSLLVCGAVLLVWHSLWGRKPNTNAPPQQI